MDDVKDVTSSMPVRMEVGEGTTTRACDLDVDVILNLQVVEGVKAILDIFVKRGYALGASVSEVKESSDGRSSFKVRRTI